MDLRRRCNRETLAKKLKKNISLSTWWLPTKTWALVPIIIFLYKLDMSNGKCSDVRLGPKQICGKSGTRKCGQVRRYAGGTDGRSWITFPEPRIGQKQRKAPQGNGHRRGTHPKTLSGTSGKAERKIVEKLAQQGESYLRNWATIKLDVPIDLWPWMTKIWRNRRGKTTDKY